LRIYLKFLRNGFLANGNLSFQGEAVWESGIIEHQSSSRYVYRAQRHQPINPTVLAEQTEKVFSSAEEAASHYLKGDLNLPGDLDGWKVVA